MTGPRPDARRRRHAARQASRRSVEVLSGSKVFADHLDELPALDLDGVDLTAIEDGTVVIDLTAGSVDWARARAEATALLRRQRLAVVDD